jgi:hypothetical protein
MRTPTSQSGISASVRPLQARFRQTLLGEFDETRIDTASARGFLLCGVPYQPHRERRYVLGERMAWVGLAIFVGTILVVAYRAGWPDHELPAPAWSIPFLLVAWALLLTGSVMASGEGDNRE